jgi:hypothetical protein
MNKKPLLLLFFFVVACCRSGAQIVLEGMVLDEHGKPIDAYVTVAAEEAGSILGFSDTDSKGHYRLEVNAKTDSLIVTAAGLSIGQTVKKVANRSQKLNFDVCEQNIELKEVRVHAEKIRQEGDTISYLVDAYQQQGDRVIGDVLKRMPGIKVSEDGRIKYNGQDIKKFYVEEMDLLQGRYGLATNNINASGVASVQVMEHHQPVKMLQGKEMTDDIAINLKLKDAAKGTIAINTLLGGGFQQAGGWKLGSGSLSEGKTVVGKNPLWTAELVGMYFAKTRQNMTLYKGNNTGDDVSRELTQHYSNVNGVWLYPFCPTNVIMPSGSGLPQKRTLDNHSHILTLNHLEKPGSDTELGLNVAYYNDRIRREGNGVSNRFLNNDNRLLSTETMTSETKMNNLDVEARYNWNAKNGFVADVLKFDAKWNSDNVDGLLTSARTGVDATDYGTERILQHFWRPEFSVINTFNTIRNIGNNAFNLHFSAGYAQRPNTLSVDVDSLLEETEHQYTQDVTSRHISGRFNTNYDVYVSNHFTFVYGINASINMHGIVTDLIGFVPPTGSAQLNNDLWYNTYCLSIGQAYKYKSRDLNFTLGFPFEVYSQSLNDKVRGDKDDYIHILFSPSFSLSWILTRNLTYSADVNYSKTVGDPGGIYSGYIMSNYRAFQRSYVDQLSETKNYGGHMSLRYRSAIDAFFANMGLSYYCSRDNQIYGYSYEGATSVVQAVNQSTAANTYSVNAEASKGFNFLTSGIRLFCAYALSEDERLITMDLYQYKNQNLNFGGAISFSPIGWMGVVYSGGFSWSRSYTDGNRGLSTIVRSNTQRVSMSIYPTKKLTLTLSAEDNYNNLTEENRHAWFGDASAKFKLKLVDLELRLNNLFDQRQYTRINYNGLDINSSTSQLRPRNVLLMIRFKLL